MNKNNHTQLSPLDTISRVDAPPFLLTRIHQKIDESQRVRFTPNVQWIIGITTMLLIVINTIAILKVTQKTNSTQVLAQSMNLLSTTSLYNE